jgi:uncharacterized protein
MEFQWDSNKDTANQRKHGIGFREAATVFYDPLSTTFQDYDHSASEQRFVTIGMSAQGRLMVIAHAEHGDTIRIINARPVTQRERKFYEEE